MSEQQQGDVQDPAQPYETEQEIETSEQPDSDEVTTDGELNHSSQSIPLEALNG